MTEGGAGEELQETAGEISQFQETAGEISQFLEALWRSLNSWKLQGRSWKSLLVKKKTFNSRRSLGRSIERVFW